MENFSAANIMNTIDRINAIEKKATERAIAELIKENDFIVNNPVMLEEIKDALPKGANIVISPLVEPNVVIMIKKFKLEHNYQIFEGGGK